MLISIVNSGTSSYAIYISLASLFISILGLLTTANNNSKFARNEFIKKQIAVVIDLVSQLHDNILIIEFTTFHHGGGSSAGVYHATIFEIPTLKTADMERDFYEQPIHFGGFCNQLSDIKKFIDNPFLPQTIADELVKFYSSNSTSIETTNVVPPRRIVIKTQIFRPSMFEYLPQNADKTIRSNNAFALENWENFKACSENLENVLRNWLNKYKVKEVNIRKDFKHS